MQQVKKKPEKKIDDDEPVYEDYQDDPSDEGDPASYDEANNELQLDEVDDHESHDEAAPNTAAPPTPKENNGPLPAAEFTVKSLEENSKNQEQPLEDQDNNNAAYNDDNQYYDPNDPNYAAYYDPNDPNYAAYYDPNDPNYAAYYDPNDLNGYYGGQEGYDIQNQQEQPEANHQEMTSERQPLVTNGLANANPDNDL